MSEKNLLHKTFLEMLIVQLRIISGNLFMRDMRRHPSYSIWKKYIEAYVNTLSEEEIQHALFSSTKRTKITHLIIDAAILNGIIRGDLTSIEFLKRKYGIKLYGFVYNRARIRRLSFNKMRIIEFIDDELNQLPKKAKSFNPRKGHAFITWYGAVLDHELIDYAKKSDKITYPTNGEEDTDEDFFDSHGDLPYDFQYLPPDEVFFRTERGRIILESCFQEPIGLPHKLICFGLRKMNYKPSEIIRQFSEKTIRDLFFLMKDEFCETSFRSQSFLDHIFENLQDQIEREVDQVVLKTDMSTRNLLKDKLNCIVGDLLLQDFYSSKPASNISDWVKSIVRALMKLFDSRE
ncbi:MAG TPA: hypothetical protein PK466_08785 [Thermotogota bacterium]|nr:hypothetical protein [Thermotogota bacterium]HPJ89216.1 hypothetical protein [Thermotogota bacterium]HPR96412.1 hypothetical protein [Thermotogota bacterium]